MITASDFSNACHRHSGELLNDKTCCLTKTDDKCDYIVPRPHDTVMAVDGFFFRFRKVLGLIYGFSVCTFLLCFFFWNYWWQWINLSLYATFIYLLLANASRISRVFLILPIVTLVWFTPFAVRMVLGAGYDVTTSIGFHSYTGYAVFCIMHLMHPTSRPLRAMVETITLAILYECLEAFFFNVVSILLPVWDLNWAVIHGIRDVIMNTIGALLGLMTLYVVQSREKRKYLSSTTTL